MGLRLNLSRLLRLVLKGFLFTARYILKTIATLLRFRRNHKDYFTCLPHELITTILAGLDWKDLLNARATCKTLCNVTKTYTLWRRLFDRLSSSYDFPIIPPNPIESYSPSELEGMVLKWVRADLGWMSETKTHSRRVVNHCPEWSWQLVEGGRWLLTSVMDGSVLAHDLDTPDMKTSILIQPREKRDHGAINKMGIYMNRDAPGLTFFIALSQGTYIPDRPKDPSRISLWRVNLVENTLGSGLISTHLTSFETLLRGYIINISLTMTEYARLVHYNRSPSTCIEIFEWGQYNLVPRHKSIIWPGQETVQIRLLPGHRVLAIAKNSAMIYDIPKPSQRVTTTHLNAPGLKDTPLHIIPFEGDLGRGGVSLLYVSPSGDAYLSVATTCHVYGVAIHAPGSLQPYAKILIFADYDTAQEDTAYGLGLQRGFIRQEDVHAVTLDFRQEHRSTVSRDWPFDYEVAELPEVDIWSGRVVEVLDNSTLAVIDFAT